MFIVKVSKHPRKENNMGSVGNTQISTPTPAVRSEQTIMDARQKAAAAIKTLSAAKRFNEITVEQPSTGDNIRISVEKVTTRDYWGRSTGRQTYTVNIYNTSQKDEYGNNERLYYNYGIEKFKDVKDTVKRIIGL